MLLNSFTFIPFLIAVFAVYYSVNPRYRILILFMASCLFIGLLSVKMLIFTLVFATTNFYLARLLENYLRTPLQRYIFWLSILLNVGLLAFFKYFNFAIENLNHILSILPSQPHLGFVSVAIPIGISYYTFQNLGYLIRINRGAEQSQKNIIAFITYLIFFPKFLAGPVERSNHFFPQIFSEIKLVNDNVSIGFRLLLLGIFKKVVIADSLADPVFLIYNNPEYYTGFPLLITMFLQTIHIYFDFSGYTDMALGSAKILGINLIDNFRRPFFAWNVGELWRRWHISLSSWCNDFIFNPIIVKYRKSGNKALIWGIVITFFVIGIWHGANWTYIVLGLLQAVAIIYEFYSKRSRIKIAGRLPVWLVEFGSILITLTFFSFSLIFFNAHSLSDAMHYITHIFKDFEIRLSGNEFIFDKVKFFLAMGSAAVLITYEGYAEKGKNLSSIFLNRPRALRWFGYYIFIILIYYCSGRPDAFVYFQF